LTKEVLDLFTDKEAQEIETIPFLRRLGSQMHHSVGCAKLAVPESWWKQKFGKKAIQKSQEAAECDCGLDESFRGTATLMFLIRDNLDAMDGMLVQMQKAKSLARNPKGKREMDLGMQRLQYIHRIFRTIWNVNAHELPVHTHDENCDHGEQEQEPAQEAS